MLCVIAGAGSVGRTIARELLAQGYQVTLVDNNPEAMKISSVAEANWILGDLGSPEVMERAETATAAVVVAATGDDTANLVISLLAKTQFGVPRVIARVNNAKNEWMFDDSWGVDVPLSTPRLMTTVVKEAVTRGIPVPIFRFHNSGNLLYTVLLTPQSPVCTIELAKIVWPEGVKLCAVMRGKQTLNLSVAPQLQADDQALFLLSGTEKDSVSEIAARLEALVAPGNLAVEPTVPAFPSQTGVEEPPVTAAQNQPA